MTLHGRDLWQSRPLIAPARGGSLFFSLSACTLVKGLVTVRAMPMSSWRLGLVGPGLALLLLGELLS